ncbi:MAG: T9SS type A sorting domain-containing protein [Cyclobacteriaceae bacterium]
MIYPNPAVNDYFLYKSKFQVERIEIMDIQNKYVQTSRQAMGNKVDVSTLRAGIFMVYFYLTDGRVQVTKLITR